MKYYLNDQLVTEEDFFKTIEEHRLWTIEQEKKAAEAAKLAAKPEKTTKARIKKSK